MHVPIKSKASKLALIALVSGLGLSGIGATTASAGVTNCRSSGDRQETGALIGALLGGVVGNKVAGNDRTLGTVAGAGLGAALGSAVGCKQQNIRADRDAAYYRDAYQASNSYVAQTNLNIRSQPTTRAAKVGALRGGETFQSLGASRDGRWILVGRNGYRVGYVASDYVTPRGYQHASYVR